MKPPAINLAHRGKVLRAVQQGDCTARAISGHISIDVKTVRSILESLNHTGEITHEVRASSRSGKERYYRMPEGYEITQAVRERSWSAEAALDLGSAWPWIKGSQE